MAKFYPTMNQNFHGSDGEQIVYEALKQNLPDSYTVFHSFAWLGSEKQWRSEGEADFVILHPALGILAIEVKAGGIAYTEGLAIHGHGGNGSPYLAIPALLPRGGSFFDSLDDVIGDFWT